MRFSEAAEGKDKGIALCCQARLAVVRRRAELARGTRGNLAQHSQSNPAVLPSKVISCHKTHNTI